MKYKLQVVSDVEEHEVPDGWFILTAFPLRTSGVHATVGVLLCEIRSARKTSADEFDAELER